MNRFLIYILFILGVFITVNQGAPCLAQDNLQFGLAMHGSPKYGPGDTHLDYANPDAPQGGTLRQAAIGTFDTLNPYAIKGQAASGLNLTYDRLMVRVWDEPFTMYPSIARGVEVADDRSWITFYLNPNARFQNGDPITVEDVIFSFETLKSEGRPNMRRIYRLVDTVTQPTGDAVRFDLKDGHDQETVMILALMPVLSKAYWQDRTFDSTTLEAPITSGPYRITEVDPGRRIVYERNRDYWNNDSLAARGHFNFDRIIYDYYRDDTVAFEAFKAGDLNLRREVDAGQWASAYDVPAVESGEIIKSAIDHDRPERAKGFIFNTRRAPFDDIRVRQALNILFDFEWANENLYYGLYSRVDSYYPNSSLAADGLPNEDELALLEPYRGDIPDAVFGPAYDPVVTTAETRRQNLRKAQRLLQASGWQVQDGVLQKNDEPFSFEILLSAPEDEKLALHFIRSLKRLGIEARPRVLDSAAFRGRLNEYDFDMVLYFWQNSLSPGTEQMLYWSCEAAGKPARWNFPGICEPAIDAIAASIAEARTREDLVTRVHALDRLLTHGHYMVPLYYKGQDFIAHQNTLKHPDDPPIYGTVLETWWMDRDQAQN